MSEGKGYRSPGPDIIRCFALFCVVSLHFFLYTKFDTVMVNSWFAFLLLTLRTGFTICVPLFLLLSGYLLNRKAPDRRYYGKLGKTLGIYVLASICCLMFTATYSYVFNQRDFSLYDQLMGILAFTTAPYSWYMEMYLGLFLLIPYLNILYHNLDSQKSKQKLILTLLAMTALPSMVNIFNWQDLRWWLTPSSSGEYAKLVPSWWEGIYPLTYYFLGCYLREYPLRLSRRQNLWLILAAYLIAGTFNYYRSRNAAFVFGPWQNYQSVFITALSVLVFQYFAMGNYTKLSPRTTKLLANLSDLCLGAYLVSWIFDRVIYYILNNRYPQVQDRLVFFFIAVPLIFLCSLALSALIHFFYRFAVKCLTAGKQTSNTQ